MNGMLLEEEHRLSIFSSLTKRERGFRLDPLQSYRLQDSVRWNTDRYFAPRQLKTAVQGSTFLAEKLSRWDTLSPHEGCVNSVLFSDCGEFIFTGSDDTHVHIYRTGTRRLLLDIPTAHANNIFYAKDLSRSAQDWVLTCAADGRVLLTHSPTRRFQLIHRHAGRAHRIAMCCERENAFFSCGEDGVCCLFDLRDYVRTNGQGSSSLTARIPEMSLSFKNSEGEQSPIFSIGVNPLNTNEIALCGESHAVSLFDVRFPSKPMSYLCPSECLDDPSTHTTGLKYSPDGKLLFVSYSGGDIYSFNVDEHARSSLRGETASEGDDEEDDHMEDSESAVSVIDEHDVDEDERVASDSGDDGDDDDVRLEHSSSSSSQESPTARPGFYRKYRGHCNRDTVKQVGIFGSNAEFVVSGSDCGHVFIWDTHSTRLIKVLAADKIGAVNCLAAHPTMPLLATSGLENKAKLWLPIGEHRPLAIGSKAREKADKLVRENANSTARPSRMRVTSLRRMLLMLTGVNIAMPDDESSSGEENNEDDAEREEGENDEDVESSLDRRPSRRRRTDSDSGSDLSTLIRFVIANSRSENPEDEQNEEQSEQDSEETSEGEGGSESCEENDIESGGDCEVLYYERVEQDAEESVDENEDD